MVSPHVASSATRVAFSVERYAVYDEFASGGMATVHFARLLGAHGFRRTVAVKRLLPHLTRDHDFSMMLVDEARLAARVRHPNVVSTLDVVQTDSELLLVMDYVHGESLAKLVRWMGARKERVPVAIACAIVADALHGLHAAHEAKDERGKPLGIVHRDVSPQNVLVGVDGITRIADFGIAKAAGRASTTQDGAVKGKLAYMSPEQIDGREVSRTSDIFSAGVVLWEALTGTRLFLAANPAETVFKIMSAPIPAPSEHEPSISAELDGVVMLALQRQPDRRFTSAREMALALEACAPSIRPSELARWVEGVIGSRLGKREQLLSEIEREGEVDTEAGTLPRQRAPEPTPVASESETGTRRRLNASEPTPVDFRPRARYLWPLLGAVALVLLAAWGAKSWLHARPSTAVALPAPLPASTPVLAPPPAVEPAPVPSVQPPPAAAVQTKPEKVRERRTRKATASCDPPYTIDSAGRTLFKVECM